MSRRVGKKTRTKSSKGGSAYKKAVLEAAVQSVRYHNRSTTNSQMTQYRSRQRPGGELKCVDTGLVSKVFGNGTAGAAASILDCLNAPNIGAGFWNRIGKRIKMKSLELRFEFFPNSTGTANYLNVDTRVMLLYDRQANGSLPATVADIISDFRSDGSPANSIFAFRNPQHSDRFIVLRDELIPMPNLAPGGVISNIAPAYVVGSTVAGPESAKCSNGTTQHWFVRLNGLETVFRGNTPTVPPNPPIMTVGDIATGSLLLFFINSDGTTPGTNAGWLVNYDARLRFYD